MKKTSILILVLFNSFLLASCGGGSSGGSAGATDTTVLSAPSNLTATASSGTVTLSWDSVAEAISYNVYQSTRSISTGGDLSSTSSSISSSTSSSISSSTSSSTSSSISSSISSSTSSSISYNFTTYNVTTNSTVITGLTNGTTYYFVVRALLEDGKESAASNEVSGLPEFPQPSTPTNLSATPSSGTVNLSWTGSVGAHYYKVYQSTATIIAADLSSYTSYNVTITSTEVRGLANGTTYYFVVIAVIGDKESAISDEVSGTPEENLIAPPTNLMVTTGNGTVALNWTGRARATYKVHQSTSSFVGVADYENLPGYKLIEVTATSIDIEGLTNGTRYYFVVTALVGGKESGASNQVSGLPDFPIPSTPTGLMVTSVSSGTVNLSWDSVVGATYKVYQSTTSSIGDDLSVYQSYDVSETSTKITALTNGETYYFVVTALANGKESLASDRVSGLPDFPIPLAPTSLTVTSESSGTVSLNWNSVAGATYKVYQSTASIGDDLSGHIFYDVAETSTKITGLMNGETYYFVVTALANGKESPASEWVSALPDFPIPSAPTSLTVTSESSGTVNLSWNSVAGASYTVYRSIGPIGDDLSTSQPYETTRNSREITGLTNNMSYYFVVTALANGKESPVSNEVSGLPEFPVPSTPTNLTASASSGTVNLSWTGSEGVHYYKVYQSTGTIIADDLSSYSSQNVTQSSIEITGLTNNTTYYFVVMAVIGDKESGISDEVSGLPEFPQPSTPTNLSATPSSGTVNLSWTGSAGVHYYKVYQSTGTIIAADLSSYTSYNVTITSTEIRGLANYTSYYFVVIAVIGDKESGISDEVSGLPEEDLIAPPTNLEATASSGTVNLNWTGRDRATYIVHQAESSFVDVAIADYGTSTNYRSYDITETSTKITGLVNGRSYYFVVTALVGSKESGASNEVTGNPDFPIPATPTGLVVSSDSSGTVNLSWDSVAGASYKVYQSTASIANDLSAYISYDVIETSREISGLTNGTLYYFVVTALENGKESPASDEIIGLPDFPIPASPTGLVVTSASSGTVNLNWNSVVGATYKVYQSTASIANDLSGSIFRDATTNSIEITGLRNGRSYYFVVTALENGKESPVSNEVDGLPDFPIPATPTDLVVTSVSSGTVNLRWNSVAGVSHKVYQSTGSIGDDLSSYTSYNVSERSIEITDLTNGTTYYFVVTALANGKESLASDEVDGLPDFPIPSTPTGLMVTGVSSGTVNLSWDSVVGATSYKVYQSSESIGDDLAGYTSAHVMTTSTEISGLKNGTLYYFVVTALANGKESAISNVVDELPDFPIPSTPTGLMVTGVSSGTVSLSWNRVAGATSYKVHQSLSSFDGIADYEILSGYDSNIVTETSIEITGLRNGRSYYFVVTALANGKESAASNEVDDFPDFPIPATPTGLVVTSVSSGTVNLNWNSVAGATSYKVYQSTVTPFGDDLAGYTSYNVTLSSEVITDLTNNMNYYFVVTALANGKESPASNEANGLPEFPQPSTPTNLTVTPSSGTVNLSWLGSDETHYYKVYQSTGTIIADDLSSYTSYNVTASTTEIRGLMNFTPYYFVVTAVIADKESAVSNEVSGTPEEDLIAPPTNLMVTDSSGAVTLNWTGREGATYTIHQARSSFFEVEDYTTLADYSSAHVAETSTKITGLMNGRSYYFVVTARLGSKESGISNEAIGLPDFPIPATPTNLIASASSGTVNLSWTGSDGAHNYKVYQSTATIIAADLSSYSSYNVSVSSTAITGLTNGTSYYFVVTALANGKESPASEEVIGLPDFPIPATPTGLVVTSVSSGTVNLSWESVAGATYKVYQSTVSPFDDDLSSYTSYDVMESSREISGLTNNRLYYFVVTALVNGKESVASNEANGLPEFPQPSTPTNLTATASSGTVTLSWTGSAETHYYKVYQSTGTIIAADLSSYTSYNVTITSKEISGLANGTTYYFVVIAVIGDKESGISDEASGLPEENLIAPPTNLEVTASSGTVNLNWTGRDRATYTVHQAEETFGIVAVADYTSLVGYSSAHVTETSTKITGLINGDEYYFVVTALVGSKESGASNEVIGYPDFPIPATPTGLVASENNGIVNLRWTGREGATYRVHQSTETFSGVADYEILTGYKSTSVTETSINITDLTDSVTYYFVVTALENGKESPASDEVSALPNFPVPLTPTGLEVTNASSGTVNLRWNSVAGASYEVHQATAAFASMVQLDYEALSGYQSTEVNTNSIEITGLINDISYYFVVTAIINGKKSLASNEVSAIPVNNYIFSNDPLVMLGIGEILTVSRHPTDTNKFVAGTGAGLVLLYSYSDFGEITLERRFTGHTGAVNSVAFNHDGTRIVSGSDDNSLRQWHVRLGRLIGSARIEHTGAVNSVAYSPNGSKIVSGSDDKTLRLWDAYSGNPLGSVFTSHTGSVRSVAFNHDGTRIVSGGDDNTIRLWDVNTQRQFGDSYTGHTDRVNSVVFGHGTNFYSASDDGTIRRWSTGNQNGGIFSSTSTASVNSVAVSPDGSKLVSGSDDNTLRLWDVNTQRQLGNPLTGHTATPLSVVFSADGDRIISGSGGDTGDNTIRLWHVDAGQEIGNYIEHADDNPTFKYVHAVAFSPDSSIIATGADNGDINLWDVNTRVKINTLTGNHQRIKSMAYSPDGTKLVSGSESGTIRLWDVSDLSAVRQISSRSSLGDVRSVAFSPDGDTVVSGSEDKNVRLWDVSSGTLSQIDDSLAHTWIVTSVAFSPDGDIVISASGNTIRRWDVSDLNAVSEISSLTVGADTAFIQSVAYSPDGSKIASGDDRDNFIRVWDVDTESQISTLTGSRLDVYSVAFSPDGSKIVGGADNIRVWDAETGSQIGPTLNSDSVAQHILSVAYSPDGHLIAGGSQDGIVVLWRANTENQLGSTSLDGHTDSVSSVAFSPDGSKIVSGSNDDTIRLWDVSDVNAVSQIVSPSTGHSNNVNSVAFSPDGSKIVSGSADNTIRLWDVNTVSQIGNSLTGHTDQVLSVAFNPTNGSEIVSGGDDNTIRLWIAEVESQLGSSSHTGSVRSVAFNYDGSKIVSGSADNTVRLWDVSENIVSQIGSPLTNHSNNVNSVAFSPDGSKIVSGSADNTIILWDVSSSTVSQLGSSLTGHTDQVLSVAFSPDGSRIVSGSLDNTIILWDVSDVNDVSQLFSFTGHTDQVLSVAFSPDGSKIVSSSADQTIRVWLVAE